MKWVMFNELLQLMNQIRKFEVYKKNINDLYEICKPGILIREIVFYMYNI